MRNKTWTTRGRPRNRLYSYDNIRLLECLTLIALKHEIDSSKFFSSFLDAFENGEAMCGELSIKCRLKKRDNAIFLITNNHNVVAQFPIPMHVLAKSNPLEGFTYKQSFMKKPAQEAKSNQYQIKDLKVGMKKINIKGRVVEVSQPRLVVTRFGFYAKVANILVADETGTIQLPLWNRQVDEISAGDLVQIENANVIIFKGIRQLKVSKSGTVKAVSNS